MLNFDVSILLFLVLGFIDPSLGGETRCYGILPGIGRMSRGVDITSLDLFPTEILAKNGYRHSLFDFSCDQNGTWSHPSIPDYSYYLPDQVAEINTVPAGALNLKIKFHQELKDYKDSLAAKVGLDVNFGIGSFSASAGYKEVKEQIMKTNRSVAETNAYVSAIQVDFVSAKKMTPSSSFMELVEEFPLKYEDDPSKYDKFIASFGTHYFESAMFGGYLFQKTVIENSYMYKTDMKHITTNVKAKFMGMVTAKVSVDKKTTTVDEEFSSNSETSFYYYGGMTNLSNQTDNSYLSKWWDTVNKDPWLFGGQLAPIENLITNTTVKRELKRAITFYRLRAFHEDLRNVISLRSVPLNKEELNDLKELATIERILYNPHSGQNDLDMISKDFDLLFNYVQEIQYGLSHLEMLSKRMDVWAHVLLHSNNSLSVIQLFSDINIKVKVSEIIRNLSSVSNEIKEFLKQIVLSEKEEKIRHFKQEGNKLINFFETKSLLDYCKTSSKQEVCVGYLKCLATLDLLNIREQSQRNIFYMLLGFGPEFIGNVCLGSKQV